MLIFHLVTKILCAGYFYILKKRILLQQKQEAKVIMYREIQAGITSLYISQLKWWKKQTRSLSIPTFIVVIKSQSVDWIKLNLLPLDTHQEQFRDILFTSAGRWINNRICCWYPSSVFPHTIRWDRNSDIDAFCPLQKKKK